MSFNRVEQSNAFTIYDDGINLGRDELVVPSVVSEEARYWAGRLTRPAASESIHAMTTTMLMGLQSNVLSSRQAQRYENTPALRPIAEQKRREVASMVAMSRLLRFMAPEAAPAESGQEEDEPTHERMLVDIDEASAPPAYSAIVTVEDANSHGEFTPTIDATEGTTWYFDAELGLYVRAAVPAQLSRIMRAALTVALGSTKAIDDMLQGNQSVQLSPYLSHAWLMEAQSH